MKAYSWIGFVAVYVAYTLAFFFVSDDIIGQINAAMGALVGLFALCFIAAKLNDDKGSTKYGRYGKRFSLALNTVLFSVLAEMLLLMFVLFMFAVVFVCLEENPVPLIPKEYYLPVTYFILSVDNRLFAKIMEKNNLVLLALAAVFLLVLFTWTLFADLLLPFALIALSGAPIIHWVTNEKIPEELGLEKG
jgi:hypothetical protein